mmetsp:Transcript_2829/g.6338  ORF Transcript_2829/g.6338 Transcript_2829/m.6338 type:complete len:91 (+) Transcript_2829:230-502(+)
MAIGFGFDSPTSRQIHESLRDRDGSGKNMQKDVVQQDIIAGIGAVCIQVVASGAPATSATYTTCTRNLSTIKPDISNTNCAKLGGECSSK